MFQHFYHKQGCLNYTGGTDMHPKVGSQFRRVQTLQKWSILSLTLTQTL